MITRALIYVCDKCLKNKAVSENNILELPNGWTSEPYKFGFNQNITEHHVCPKCIEKKQIEDTFK
jgi:hypothetical protein